MSRKLLSVMIVLAFAGALFGQACSEYGMTGDSGSASKEANFNLSASTTSLSAGAQTLITASGGTYPYTWSVDYGGGSISSNGLYTAPATVTPLNNSVIVTCTDALGNAEHITLYVNSNALTATYSPNPASPGNAIYITILGGTPPYTIQRLSAVGTVNGNYYQSTLTPETATFEISDGKGIRTNLSIPIGTSLSSSAAFSALTVTNPGVHQPGGGGCTSPATQAGSVADGYGNTVYGDQMFCGTLVTATNGTRVITDIVISPTNGGAHASNPTCPSGYSEVGAVTDCAGGGCYGYQKICAQYGTMATGTRPVLEFKVTAQNAHTNSPSCGSLTTIGYTADCGYATCSGYQAFCLRK